MKAFQKRQPRRIGRNPMYLLGTRTIEHWSQVSTVGEGGPEEHVGRVGARDGV